MDEAVRIRQYLHEMIGCCWFQLYTYLHTIRAHQLEAARIAAAVLLFVPHVKLLGAL